MIATHLAKRAVIRLSPTDGTEDVRAFLQGLVTNDVAGDLPVWAGLLSAQGKAMFDFLVWEGRESGTVLLDCEAEAAEELVKRLSLYRLRRKIAIEQDDALAVHWSTQPGDGRVVDPRLPQLGYRWFAPAGEAADPADDAWLAHRLACGVPEGRAELGDILWLETNAVELNGVSFTKGCYIGQENTARMNWRQKVNRRLVVVPLGQSEEKRRKVAYPELGLAVDHLRVEDITNPPDWMRLTADGE
ncbi:MAG: folate-binding protein YgfZ [Sphingomonadaceae bacterium]|nr:folate-binding protein YgfZ [Sphingomonadaceae bacterium]